MAKNEIDYKRYLQQVKRHKKLSILTALAIMTLVTAGSFLVPSKYEASSTVFIEKSVISELLKGLTFTPSTEDKIKVLSYALNSRTLITKVLDELDMKKGGDSEQEVLIKKLQENTTIKIKDKEGLFVIAFRDKSPKVARDYVNALVRRYIDENTSSKREESYGATKFVSEQLKTFKEKLDKAEEAVNAYKSGAGSTANLDPGMLLKDINDSQQRLDDVRIRRSQVESTLHGLDRANSVQSNLPAMQKRLQELQLQYTDSYPEIQRLKEDIQAVEERDKSGAPVPRQNDSAEYRKLSSELKALKQAESNLSSTIARNRALSLSIPAARAKLENLEREKSAQKALYDSMLAREGQSEVSKQMEVQDKSTVFRVVDPAVIPFNPVSPNRPLIILGGILAGLLCGVGIVLLMDQMDGSVKNLELAKGFGLPVLAVIPRIEDPQQILLQRKKDRRLYCSAAGYFTIILVVLGTQLATAEMIAWVTYRLKSFI